MININKGQTNDILLYLNGDVTISNPIFVFEFKDVYNKSLITSIPDKSTVKGYNLFSFNEASYGYLYANGELNVYESIIDTSSLTNLNKIYNGLYKLIVNSVPDITFDPSIQYTDTVYDPSNGNPNINEDVVFDPIWVSGKIPQMGIPANVIIQDTSHLFVSQDEKDKWNSTSGVSQLYVDGSLNQRDASITYLYSQLGGSGVSQLYVDGSLALRDSSINSLIYKDLQIDNSLNEIFIGQHVQDVSIISLTDKDLIHDVSISNINNINNIQDASILQNKNRISEVELLALAYAIAL